MATFSNNARRLRRLPDKVRERFYDWRAPRYSSGIKFHLWPWSFSDVEHLAADSVSSDRTYKSLLEAELRQNLKLSKGLGVALVGSGRSALRLGLIALRRLRPDRSKIVLPTYCCGSVYDAAVSAGLTPIFIDTTESLNSVAADYLKALDGETLGVIVVNLFGRWMAEDDRQKIFETCRHKSMFVLEDNAQCYRPYPEDSATTRARADIEIHSFGFGKLGMATAGGALVFDQAAHEIWEELKSYHPGSGALALRRFRYFEAGFGTAEHLKSDPDTVSNTTEQYGAEEISELDAALALQSLRDSEKILRRSIEIGRRYAEVIKKFPKVYRFHDSERNIFFRFPVILRDVEATNAFWAHMALYKIELEGMYVPLHLRYPRNGQPPCVVSEELYRYVFNVPNRVSLLPSEIDRIVGALADFGKRRSR